MIRAVFVIKNLYFIKLLYRKGNQSIGNKNNLLVLVQWQLKDPYNILNVLMNIHRVKQQK